MQPFSIYHLQKAEMQTDITKLDTHHSSVGILGILSMKCTYRIGDKEQSWQTSIATKKIIAEKMDKTCTLVIQGTG